MESRSRCWRSLRRNRHAGDYQAGQQALDAGNVDEALAQWRAAADAGDRRAMLALARLYLQGLGVLQDYVEAHKWFNLAASRGESAALKERDGLTEKMTPAQIATAQERAAAWRPGGGRTDGAPDANVVQTAATGSGPGVSPPPPRAIREAQSLLATLGYRPGPADGIWGRRTGGAYRAFLRDAGLPAAETLTPEVLRVMRKIAKRRAGATKEGRSAPAPQDSVPTMSVSSTPRPATVPPVALHRAAKAGDIDGIKVALAAGVDVNARDGRGRTALMYAVNEGYTLMVPLLLAADGVDVDVRAADGATALYMAIVHGQGDVVDQLLKAGANISIKGTKSKTPMEIAELRGDEEVIALLKKAKWDDAAFARATSSGNYRGYLSSRPHGRHADEARRMLAETERKADDAAFAKAASEDTGAAYARYLKSNPNGRHADDAAFARAEWVGTGPAYVAYLEMHPQGKRAAEAKAKSTVAGPALNPKCPELPGEYRGENHGECWQEIVGLPGCYRWSYHYHSDRPAEHWSGTCAGGITDGHGTLFMSSGSEHPASVLTGTYVKGKAHGNWVGRYDDGSVWQGLYVHGKEHGQWIRRGSDGDVYEGPYVDGNRHGQWIERLTDGRVGGGAYVDDKRHGDWVINHEDGTVSRGRYVDGEQQGKWVERGLFLHETGEGSYSNGKKDGEWVFRRDDGTVERGPFRNGKHHGDWVITHDDGTVSRGPFLDGEKHGKWVEPLFGQIWEGPYRNGKKHGDWVITHDDGTVSRGPYVNNEMHGKWVERQYYPEGIGEGSYRSGERHGDWIIKHDDGNVSRGPYVDGEKHGKWIEPPGIYPHYWETSEIWYTRGQVVAR